MPITNLPISTPLYSAEQTRLLDRRAIDEFGIPGYTLMCRAAEAAWQCVQQRWPDAKHFLLLCGAGNNAGDGYVFARLALAAGKRVQLLWLASPSTLQGDALTAWQDYQRAGGTATSWEAWAAEQENVVATLASFDVIGDALFGTGLSRDAAGRWAEAINACNQQRKHNNAAAILAFDIPSGLHADTGQVLGTAIKADCTITFIAEKVGMHSGSGPEHCGQLERDDLNLPATVYDGQPAAVQRLERSWLSAKLPPRPRSTHKGNCGHALLVGGNLGMGGAIQLAASACLHSGAGLTTVATRAEHVTALLSSNAEAMSIAVGANPDLKASLDAASVIAIGPGLGQCAWAQHLFQQCLDYCCDHETPLIVDADGLNLLAKRSFQKYPKNWLLTPHPGEAARLLDCDTREIQQDRCQAARDLQDKYQAAVILKGNASLIAANDNLALCPFGNPGMASGGMGDVLTGVAAALLAQAHGLQSYLTMNLFESACAATLAHALAADSAAESGQRGLLARDVIAQLRTVIN